jgi:hypothetical protein
MGIIFLTHTFSLRDLPLNVTEDSMSTNHIPVASLFERARLKTELDSAAQTHLDDCDLCRNRLNWMEVAAGLGPNELSYEPPQSVMNSVLRMGRNGSRLKQLRNVIVALLKVDSFTQLAPAGVRHGETTSRQMTFEGEDVEIGIWLRASNDQTWTLSGQVLEKSSGPVRDPSGHVDLVVEGDHVRTSPLSPWGEFVFTHLQKTPYSLQVHFLNRVVQIPSLPLLDEE